MEGDKNKDNRIDLNEFKSIYKGILKMELQIKKSSRE